MTQRHGWRSDVDSILTSIKKLLGIPPQYTQFDEDIIIYINSAFLTLAQLGVGPEEGFSIKDSSAVWDDYIVGDELLVNAVKSYIYLKVKMLFDPAATGAVLELMKSQIAELEWRMNVHVEPAVPSDELPKPQLGC
jgi:hypothetical protein